jgi:hypothetical protein
VATIPEIRSGTLLGEPISVPPHLRAVAWRSAMDAADGAAAAREVLRVRRAPLYALLDAARGGRVRKLLRLVEGTSISLYAGEHVERLAEVAPYLVPVPEGTGLLDELLAEGWGRSFGIYLESRAPVERILAHLRYLLFIRDPAGREIYFRYYDPRVLRTFLPVVTAGQADYLFGAVDTIFVEGEDGSCLHEVTSAEAARLER